MIWIINGVGEARHRLLLDTMFADRKRLFVDLLGWDVPVLDGRYEIDQFDGEHAIYFAATDALGMHVASLRLLPTDRPHILDTLFARLCPDGVPTGLDTCEITRLCLPARHDSADRLGLRNRLISAMVDQALTIGITTLTGVVTEAFRRQVLAMGWCSEPLGPAQSIDGTALGAFRLHIDRDTPARLGANGIYTPGTLPVEHGRAVA